MICRLAQAGLGDRGLRRARREAPGRKLRPPGRRSPDMAESRY